MAEEHPKHEAQALLLWLADPVLWTIVVATVATVFGVAVGPEVFLIVVLITIVVGGLAWCWVAKNRKTGQSQ
jgi:ABC-type amino acid transport system permease subunit